MKILQLVYSCVPGNYRGGIAKIVFDISRHQAALGHEVHICTTNYNSSVLVDVPLDRPVWNDGVCIHYFKATSLLWMRSPDLHSYLLNNAMDFDVVHSHNIFLALNWYAAKVKRTMGVPLFNHTHGALDPVVVNQGRIKAMKKRLYIKFIERANLNMSDSIIANTPYEEEQIRRSGMTAPVRIIPNGVDPYINKTGASERFCAELGISPKDKVVAFVGRIVPKKGLHNLLTAFALVAAVIPEAILVIAGDRTQCKEYVVTLDRIASEAGIDNRVVWTGFLDESRKAALLDTADAFFHVSQSEGMAMAILEAMSAGLPTLVSRRCYMSEAAKNGAVVEVSQRAESIAKAMTQILTDESYRHDISKRALQFIETHHNWNMIAEKLLALYGTYN